MSLRNEEVVLFQNSTKDGYVSSLTSEKGSFYLYTLIICISITKTLYKL